MNFRFIRTNDGIALKIDAATTDEIAALNELLLDRRMRTVIKPVVRVDNLMEGNQVKSIVISQKCYLTKGYLDQHFHQLYPEDLSERMLFYTRPGKGPFLYFVVGVGRYCGFKIKTFNYDKITFYSDEKTFRFFLSGEMVYEMKLSKKNMSIHTLGDLNEFLK